jgi:hypothetical protein
MAGRDALYLKPGMTDGELLGAYRARNAYYEVISEGLAKNMTRFGPGTDVWVDLLGRTGYASLAVIEEFCNRTYLIEDRLNFRSNAWEKGDIRLIKPPTLADSIKALETIEASVDAVMCCEQMSFLQQDFGAFARSLGILKEKNPDLIFGGTMGPSHHTFQTYRVADFRNGGVVDTGEVMTELSHPIHQAVHREVVRIAKERHRYTRDDAYPHPTPFSVPDLREKLTMAGFENLVIFENLIEVPGGAIHEFCQNAWTFYMRFPPLSELPTDAKIDILTEAIEAVRALPAYDNWCGIPAQHPVAYYIASR